MITLECGKNHNSSVSKYPRNKVPIILFRKNPDDPESPLYKICLDCRNYNRKCASGEIYLKNHGHTPEKNFKICKGDRHRNVSKYDKFKVPIELFRKIPEDPKSGVYESCIDCRVNQMNRKVKKQHVIKSNEFCCSRCNKVKNMNERELKRDYTYASNCKDCVKNCKILYDKSRNNFNKLRLDFIKNFQVSCQKCNKIYLKSDINNDIIALDTFESDYGTIVEYKNEVYFAKDFLQLYENRLELRIIQFDHLPEEELRERGMLLPEEAYIKKKKNVGHCFSKDAMITEVLKCQHLCCKCHIEETIRREIKVRGERKMNSKQKYVKKIKLNGKCELCGFSDPKIPRFFDFDHKKPQEKIANISLMVQSKEYTMNDLIIELNKCRILCKHCHITHTNK